MSLSPEERLTHIRSMFAAGQHEEAIALCRMALMDKEPIPAAIIDLSYMLYVAHPPAEALQVIEQALEQFSSQSELNYYASVCLARLGRFEESFIQFKIRQETFSSDNYENEILFYNHDLFLSALRFRNWPIIRESFKNSISVNIGVIYYFSEELGKALRCDPAEDGIVQCVVPLALDLVGSPACGMIDDWGRLIERLRPELPWGPVLQAVAGLEFGLFHGARRRLAQAHALLPAAPNATSLLMQLVGAVAQTPPVAAMEGERTLVIRAWGSGFWADVHHVATMQIIADITGRTPTVFWGGNSFYTDDATQDAFTKIFEPISELDPLRVAARDDAVYPTQYVPKDIIDNSPKTWPWSDGYYTGLLLLNRPEPIVFGDYYTPLRQIQSWAPQDHWATQIDEDALLRRMLRRFRLQPALAADIDALAAQYLNTGPVLAWHVRNAAAKAPEDTGHGDANARIDARVDRLMQEQPDLRLFLMTDQMATVTAVRARYGERMFTLDSVRTENTRDMIYTILDRRSQGLSCQQLAYEIVKESYLALRCRYFAGNLNSAVACSIWMLRDWEEDQLVIEGVPFYRREPFWMPAGEPGRVS